MRIADGGRVMGMLSLLAMLAACSQPATLSPYRKVDVESAAWFVYERPDDFDLEEHVSGERDDVIIKDISYAAYNELRGRLQAYLVMPRGQRSFAGIVFFHWLGRPKGDRNEFLDEALSLAKQGAASLLIQGFFPWSEPFTDIEADRRRIVEQTIELRRAIDLLLAQPGIDPQRIGYVGHDYGAMYGAITAGLETRVKTYILVAGMGSFSDWSLRYWPATAAAGEAAYRQAMRQFDPAGYISHASPASLFFQFANSDRFISKAEAATFAQAASEPKRVEWYDGQHDLNIEAARRDRRDWLMEQLGLTEVSLDPE